MRTGDLIIIKSIKIQLIANSTLVAEPSPNTNTLGQLITRMSVIAKHAYLYGLGLPEVSAKKALRRIPWQAARHLCLYIFSIDDSGNVTRYSPIDFKKNQKSRPGRERSPKRSRISDKELLAQ